VDVNQSTTPEVLPLYTPGGTKRSCSTELKPYDGLKFYKTYVEACGFNVRKATATKSKKGDVTFKYFLCNKAGFKEKQKAQVADNLKDNEGGDVVVQSSSISRKRLLIRLGCKAK
ncbi:Protein FAR1-RELATED SEQUENCE 5, partial [Bienertia sinuspersici]